MTNDLWPEKLVEVNNTRENPVVILCEQVALLGEKTNNLVTARVESGTHIDQKLRHDFWIVAQALENYRYRLFSVIHPIEIYPLYIVLSEVLGNELDAIRDHPGRNAPLLDLFEASRIDRGRFDPGRYYLEVHEQKNFTENIKRILGSQHTIRVINSLLSLIQTNG